MSFCIFWIEFSQLLIEIFHVLLYWASQILFVRFLDFAESRGKLSFWNEVFHILDWVFFIFWIEFFQISFEFFGLAIELPKSFSFGFWTLSKYESRGKLSFWNVFFSYFELIFSKFQLSFSDLPEFSKCFLCLLSDFEEK